MGNRKNTNTNWPVLMATGLGSGSGVGESSSGARSEFDNDSRGLIVKQDDPYYLHGADHPGLMLVSHPLTGGNFLSRKSSMITALEAKNKLAFVN